MAKKNLWVLNIFYSTSVSLIVGFLVLKSSESIKVSILSALVSAVISFSLFKKYQKWSKYNMHHVLFDEINSLISPPAMCPALFRHARLHIVKTLDALKTKTLIPLKNGGLTINWKGYGALLTSSISYNENQFRATCLLTPVQFMDPIFTPYRLALEKLKCCFSFFYRNRFRIIAVDKDFILRDNQDAGKRKIMEDFFKWHKKIGVRPYFLSQKKFNEIHLSQFSSLELNDCVYFKLDNYKWVIGASTEFLTTPDISSEQPKVRIIDSEKGNITDYYDFLSALKKAATQLKSLSDLVSWSSSEDKI